jgi:hypothetical protein
MYFGGRLGLIYVNTITLSDADSDHATQDCESLRRPAPDIDATHLYELCSVRAESFLTRRAWAQAATGKTGR